MRAAASAACPTFPPPQWPTGWRQPAGPARRAERPVTGTARTYAEIAARFGVSESTVTSWGRQGAPIRPRRPNDLAAIERWHRQRQGGREGLSRTTANHYLRAAKSFTAWLIRERRMAADPLKHLAAVNARTERRRKLPPPEFQELIRAAWASEAIFRGLTGRPRGRTRPPLTRPGQTAPRPAQKINPLPVRGLARIVRGCQGLTGSEADGT